MTSDFERAVLEQKRYLRSLTARERDAWHRNMYVSQCAKHLETVDIAYMIPPGGADDATLFLELQRRWQAVKIILPNGDKTWRLSKRSDLQNE